jgi:hypothetical protein
MPFHGVISWELERFVADLLDSSRPPRVERHPRWNPAGTMGRQL